MASDIELDPGPTTKGQEQQLPAVVTIFQKLETGQAALFNNIKKLEESQKIKLEDRS
ncbi:MAG: hypothetical protein O7C60_06130 [Rickettsia endosymbiont of Ixodes persulcatus]|nr:hypothetical protein [Rickettsia endosymbiont of Ixodes persulcatus]